jgi:hypothetical protein
VLTARGIRRHRARKRLPALGGLHHQYARI